MKKSTYKIFTLTTVILCLATLAIAWTSCWFSNWNMEDWSKKWSDLFGITQSEQTPSTPGTPDGDGGGTINPDTPPIVDQKNNVIAVDREGNGITAGSTVDFNNLCLTAAPANAISADNTFYLNVTLTPDNANDYDLVWSINWENPNNPALNGQRAVTECVQITPDVNNSKKCSLSYKNWFLEPIIVKVIDKISGLEQQCKIDCRQFVRSVEIVYDVDSALLNRYLNQGVLSNEFSKLHEYPNLSKTDRMILPNYGQRPDKWKNCAINGIVVLPVLSTIYTIPASSDVFDNLTLKIDFDNSNNHDNTIGGKLNVKSESFTIDSKSFVRTPGRKLCSSNAIITNDYIFIYKFNSLGDFLINFYNDSNSVIFNTMKNSKNSCILFNCSVSCCSYGNKVNFNQISHNGEIEQYISLYPEQFNIQATGMSLDSNNIIVDKI